MLQLLTIMAFILGQDTYRLTVTPFDFEDEKVPASFVKDISQLETAGNLLFIRESSDPAILVLDRQGKFLRRIGSRGQGPNELGGTSVSFGVNGRSLWTVAANMKSAHYFENGAHLQRISLKSYNRLYLISSTSQALAFSNEHIIFPSYPNKQVLALAYDYGGDVVKEFPVVFKDKSILAKNPSINDTLWARDEQRWYCLFKYQPFLITYDHALNELNRFPLDGPEIQVISEAFYQHERKKKFDISPLFFSDIKVFGGKVFLMTEQTLYQIDPETGKTLRRMVFVGSGPDFEQVDKVDPRLNFCYFSFWNDGTIILGHPAMMWDHNLWTTKLPFVP